MKIQPTNFRVAQNLSFGHKRPTIKIPENLNLKPKSKAPSAFLLGLFSVVSLLAGGTWLYRQTYQYKFQSLWKQYQQNYNEIVLDSTSTKQDSINYMQKRDSLTVDFLQKFVELKSALNKQTADTAYIDLSSKRYSSYDSNKN